MSVSLGSGFFQNPVTLQMQFTSIHKVDDGENESVAANGKNDSILIRGPQHFPQISRLKMFMNGITNEEMNARQICGQHEMEYEKNCPFAKKCFVVD